MRMWKQGGRSLFCVVSLIVCGAGVAQAANGTWTGTTDSYWDKDSNWGGTVRPYLNETATFNGPGNGKTEIDLKKIGAATLAIRDVVFTGADCAAYTLGKSGQQLWFMNSGTLTITPDVVNDQTIGGASTRYGNSTNVNTTIKLINNSLNAKLLLNSTTSAFTATKTKGLYVFINLEGVGDITFNQRLVTNGVTRFALYNYNTGTITLAGAGENRINHLYTMANSAPPGDTHVVLNSGTELFIDYGSTDYSIWHEGNGVIEGAGTLRFGTGTNENFAHVYVKTGSTLTIRTALTSAGGLEMRSTGSGGGTLVLDGINAMASNLVNTSIGSISVAKIGNRGSMDSNVGSGQRIQFNGSGSRLIYTGLGETTDRLFEFNTNARLDQSGSGDLILAEDLVLGAINKTLTLMGSASGTGEIAGVIGLGAGTTSLAKEGTGLWRLSAKNTYAGWTTVRNGTLALTGAAGAITVTSKLSLETGVLRLENNVMSNNMDRLGDAIPLTLKNGTLAFVHNGGATNYSETIGALTIDGNNNTVTASQAAEGYTSTVTFASLVRTDKSTVNFTGVGLGADNRNRIRFTTPPVLVNGYIGAWATVNGTELAMYDETLGVIPGPSTNIAARGPASMIPDDGGLNVLSVRITAAGTADAIVLEGAAGSSIYSLTQLTDTPAVVATADNKTLSAYSVMIDQDAGALTIGENPGDGMLKTDAGDCEMLLANFSTNALTVNAAVADNAGTMSLTKTGKGELVFNGLAAVTGQTKVQEGGLTFNSFADQTNQLGQVVLTGGAEMPTRLNINGPTEIVNSNSISHASLADDRCVMHIAGDLTLQGNEKTNGRFDIGSGKNSAGAVMQTAGAVSVSSGRTGTAYFTVGNNDGYGYYRLSGGSLTSGEMTIGGSSTPLAIGNVSVFDLYGGELTVDGWCLLISWGRGMGALNIFGGSFGLAGAGSEVLFTYNNNTASTAQLNLLGPDAKMFDRGSATRKCISLARGGTNTLGALNLNNGELTLYRAYAEFGSKEPNLTTPSHFNFNGGLLIAANNSPTLMQGLTAAHVFPGGARIDTAGFAVTINQPLVAPVGYGVTDITLTSGGVGYIGAPAVEITGGSGTGATAIALVDLEPGSSACGQVTNILVTSAGSGYCVSDTLAAALLGGGCLTTGTLSSVTKGVNASGGLTKLGAGILTLGGACTYSGGTTISNGTLKLGIADALLPGSAVTLAGGTLDLNGLTVSNTVFGAGSVVNGTLYSEFSPAGTNVVGSQTSAASIAALTGVYYVDVNDEGESDMLTFEGDANLSGLVLEIVDPKQLNRKKVYSISTVTGTRSGLFAPTNLTDDRWHVSAGADGEVRLFFADGLILQLR